MKRLVLTLILVTLAEIYAFIVFRNHPISRPDYFPALLTVIQFFMSYGGIESARWLLRKSPVANTPGPDSDWTRLWIWLGPPGGLLMIATSILALLTSKSTPGWLPPAIILGHAAGGGILWLFASLEMLPSLARIRPSARSLNGGLALVGLFTHLTGIIFYSQIYPAGQLKVGLFLVAVLLTYFVFYYVWLSCMFWGLVFLFWKPPTEEINSSSEHGSQLPG